jgi:hypothetical protein
MSNLLSLDPERAERRQIKISDLIPERSVGPANSIYELQNYVVGVRPGGLVMSDDGSLDMNHSFRRIDYFSILGGARVRNNVQRGIGNRPIDFTAARIPLEAIEGALTPDEMPYEDAIWLYAAPTRQALILSRKDQRGLLLRYLPVANLSEDKDGRVRFDRPEPGPDFPLKLWEDANLAVPLDRRSAWLGEWRNELDWFRAVHQTEYSNAIIGLHEQFSRHLSPGLDATRPGMTEDERLLTRFRRRRRELTEADILLLASNHWNFDVRGFNPGGNHGAFFRVSTHATLMFAGGDKTGIPRGLVVEEPYDSLSFVPSILTLAGRMENKHLRKVGWTGDVNPFPGRVIKELFEQRERPVTVTVESSGRAAPR